MEEARAIPLYDKGSLWSVVLDLGIGLIMHLFHIEGIILLSKQTLNKTCKKETDVSLRKTLTGISLIPQALPFFRPI